MSALTIIDRTRTAPTTEPIDAELWPDVATVPHSPVRAAIAKRIFHRAAGLMPLRVVEPGGRSYGAGAAGAPVMRLVRPEAFFARLGATGTIGFGEAYMAGDWTSTEIGRASCRERV